jgi:tetratricopeptide (TPR) repeat protein
MGVAYKNMGNLDMAIEKYHKAVEIDPKYYKALNNLGVAYYKKNFYEEAQAFFRKALEIMPGYEVAKKNLEAAQKKDVVFRETIEKLKEKIKEDENNPLLHYDLANSYRNTGHLEDAIVEYKKALELRPENIDEITNIGAVFYETGNYDEAIKYFISTVSKSARDGKAHLFLANSYFKKEWWDEADIEYHKTLELDPTLMEVYYKLGDVYRSKGWWDEAIEMWKKYIDRNPDSELANLSQDNIRMIEIWKKELQLSPSAGRKKIIK